MLREMQRPRARPAHGTVTRALAILRLVGKAPAPLGVMEIARQLGVHKSSVSRLLATLATEGFVVRDPMTERFAVGPVLVTLAGNALRQMDLRHLAREALEALAAETSETVNLAVPARGGVINIDKIASPHYIRDIGWIGRQTPFHCTATGKALIAWRRPTERRALVGSRLPRHTARTITSRAALERELARTRARGYALGIEELEVGLIAVAAPVRNREGQVVATVSVSGPSLRLTPSTLPRHGAAVMRAAERVSERLRGALVPRDAEAMRPAPVRGAIRAAR
jgi:DNA-binding IclR family transcriptional regulator